MFCRLPTSRQLSKVAVLSFCTIRYNTVQCEASFDSYTPKQVGKFLKENDLAMYSDKFEKYQFTGGRLLKGLSDKDLVTLGVLEFHRKKLRNAIQTASAGVSLPKTYEEVRDTLMPDFEHSSSFSNFEAFLVKNYHLELDVDFENKELAGYIDVTFEKLQDKYFISLDCKDLVVEKVTNLKTGKEMEFNLCSEHSVFGTPLVIRAPEDVNIGENFRVKIDYKVVKEGSVQFLSPSCTHGKKRPYLFTQSQAIHSRTLFPGQDTPAVKSNYTAGITTPSWARGLMSATPTGSHRVGNSKRYTFEQRNKIPTYLLALAVGEIEGRRISDKTTVWSEPGMVDSAAWEFGDTPLYLKTAEDICGPYSWDTYDIVCLPPAFPYGGMENPQLTFVTPTLIAGDRSLGSVIAHEITHSWAGNLVTNSSWNEFWLNEGFTMYVENRILRKAVGEDLESINRALTIDAWRSDVKNFGETHEYTKLIQNLPDSDPDDAFSRVPYVKGREFLNYLESIIGGPDEMESFIKAYFKKFSNKTVTSYQMKECFEDFFADKDLSSIDWETWCLEPGIPEQYLTPQKSEALDKVDQLVEKMRQIYLKQKKGSLSLADMSSWLPQATMVLLDRLGTQVKADLQEGSLSDQDLRKFIMKLNNAFKFDDVKNAEIKFRWLKLCLLVSERKEEAAAMATAVGRMKFVRPLYRALAEVDLEYAKEVFHANENIYHPICVKMVRSDLEKASEK